MTPLAMSGPVLAGSDGRPVANEACLFNKEGSPEAPFQKHYRFSAEDQEP
jgi:hypothetical protein